MDTIAMTAVYPHDAAYARAHGELAEYRNARRRNIACKDAIEEAIAKRNVSVREHENTYRVQQECRRAVVR